jgi:hypothetical protein
VSFSAELRRELARQGIDARRARRIVAELEDHAACDPDAHLGSPQLIAARFAEELRLTQTRRATYLGFLALIVTAASLSAVWLGISAAGGWPEFAGLRGPLVVLGGLAIILGGQVAFVAGVLALSLFVLRSGELRLVQRRMRVALAAAALAVAGEALHAVALRPMLPAWWFALATSVTAASAIGLVCSWLVLRRAGALTPRAPVAAAGLPLWFVLGSGLTVIAVMTIGTAHAERSWIEGLIRGVLEGVAFICGFFALGRFLGLRASIRHETVTTLRQ